MISVDIDQLYTWINAFLWPFFRILALLGTAPLLGESSIPTRVKVGFAAIIAVAIAPTLAPMPAVPTASFAGIWIAVQQVFIGMALGLTMRIVFAAVQTAGEFIGLQMGLSFASFFDPATGANTAVLSRLMNVVAMLVFMALNGHLLMLGTFAHSFDILPIRMGALDPNGWGVLFEWSSQVMVSGMLLALPLIIVLLTINLSLGILNRTAQQLSVFAVGFPISLLVGLTLLAIVLPQTTPFLSRLFDAGYASMARLVQALAGA
ncbi:flagellar biosynthetic protein FliR [Pollutimonas bauzanensis]|uniref:Flagellar biosynthetic protein FliR n=1 Tax=Pollutimonas bauzanensis TaxID=658167 RepID=A0A1M5Z4B3_9BURK|nr:flagellar biosynthetic protein FliR [Pollutimonas bauzanensis]SHI19102.1 flagellar biosynthetic protein FliR [Pollutimonas bauzanensis]